MIQVSETYVNKSEGHGIGESGWYTPYTDDKGQLFRGYQREYGRCVGKVYIDQLQVNGRMVAIPVGWVFEGKDKYGDCNKTYLREVWVTFRED